MKKKTLICLLAAAMVTASCTYSLSYADSKADKQEQLDDIRTQTEDVKNDMSQLVTDIENQQAEVDKLEAEMNSKQAQIEQAQADIEQTVRDMEQRQQGLNSRLRTMYKNGSIGYLDVLLGSGSLSEFLTNLEMIQRIYRNDQNTLEELERQEKELSEKEAALKVQKQELSSQKTAAEEKQQALQADKNTLQEKLDELNAEADRISSEIAALQNPSHKYEGGSFMWPTNTTLITSPFGFRIHPVTGVYTGHTGVDIGCSYGSPVYAAADGTVIVASYGYGGYGVAVVIDHGSGISTLYGHNDSLHVSVGQKVSRGDVIAASGNSGVSTGPHLHFEVRVNGSYVDPMSYF